MANKELRGMFSLKEIQDKVARMMPEIFAYSFDRGKGHEFVPPKNDSSTPLTARKLVEVFKLKVFNLTEEDLEIYGTVEISAGDLFSRYIYRRGIDDCVLVKSKESVSLLLNGPKSVFGLDFYNLSFIAFLLDKRDECLVHVGSFHDHGLKQEVRTIELNPLSLSYGNSDDNRSPPEVEERKRMYSLRVAVTYVLYDHAVAAFLKVRLLRENSFPVYGVIIAESDVYRGDMSCLFMKRSYEAQLVSPGHEIVLSKQLVAIPCNGTLFVKVALPGLVHKEFKFIAKQEGEDDPPQVDGRIEVSVAWKSRCSNYIEAIEEGEIVYGKASKKKV